MVPNWYILAVSTTSMISAHWNQQTFHEYLMDTYIAIICLSYAYFTENKESIQVSFLSLFFLYSLIHLKPIILSKIYRHFRQSSICYEEDRLVAMNK